MLYAGLVLTTMIWGGSFVAIKRALCYIAPVELILVRFVPASLVFATLLWFGDRSAVREMVRKEWLSLGAMGLLGVVCYGWALNAGEQLIPAGTASLLISLNPLFIFALSALFLGERVAWQRVVGLGVALAGLFIIIRFASGDTIEFSYLRGVLITILAPLSWSVYTVVGRPLAKRYPPLAVTGAATILGTLPLLAAARLSLLHKLRLMPWDGWVSIAYLSLACTVAGFTVWSAALKRLEASRVAGFVYLVPVWGVTLSSVLLRESVTRPFIFGAAIVITGVALVSR